MKKIFFLICVITSLFHKVHGQNYSEIDSIVDKYPADLKTTNHLVTLINKDFARSDQKARAAFRWIATHIAYDENLGKKMEQSPLKAFSYTTEKERLVKEKQFQENLTKSAMATRTAVCHGYSILFEKLCKELGLEVKTIIGTLKSDPSQIGKLPGALNHAWNVVKIDGDWKFVDATLAAGFISEKTNAFKFYFNDGYFFTSPERFFLNHYPSDEKWLLVSKTKKDFAQLPLVLGRYLEKGYQLVRPVNGIYSSLKNENFKFSIQGLDEYDSVEYSFGDKRNSFDQDNSKDYTISLSEVKNGFLQLFVNGKIIAIYKIEKV